VVSSVRRLVSRAGRFRVTEDSAAAPALVESFRVAAYRCESGPARSVIFMRTSMAAFEMLWRRIGYTTAAVVVGIASLSAAAPEIAIGSAAWDGAEKRIRNGRIRERPLAGMLVPFSTFGLLYVPK